MTKIGYGTILPGVALAILASLAGFEVRAEAVEALAASARPIQWVDVKGGCFRLGEDGVYPEEGPPTEVCVEPFSLATHEITVAQFAAFVAATGHVTAAEKGWSDKTPRGETVDVPAGSFIFEPRGRMRTLVDWWQYREGAFWLSPLGETSLGPAEAQNPVVHVAYGDAEAFARWAGGRLPTEAEWEWAAVSGAKADEAKTDDPQANTWQGIFPVQNTKADGYAGVAPVGSFGPDALGLHDMIGNVWEWTASIYYPRHGLAHESAAEGPGAHHPDGFDPGNPGRPVRVLKGGSYLCARSYCYRFRPAARQAQDRDLATSHIGFRIVANQASVKPSR
ncbi:MAG: formylglycine-generating enzyme family protein [Alphaproteobacteria bacterium]